MSNDQTNDGGRQERAGANATAQGKNQSNSTDTVTVGCKLPHGLILDLTVPGQVPRRFRVKGMNAAGIIGGFGITPGVPRDFWEAWIEKNKALDFVKRELIFAYAKPASAESAARERAKERTGMEPIDPNAKGDGGLPKDIKTLEKDPA